MGPILRGWWSRVLIRVFKVSPCMKLLWLMVQVRDILCFRVENYSNDRFLGYASDNAKIRAKIKAAMWLAAWKWKVMFDKWLHWLASRYHPLQTICIPLLILPFNGCFSTWTCVTQFTLQPFSSSTSSIKELLGLVDQDKRQSATGSENA